MVAIPIVLILLVGLYLFSLKGRTHHKWMRRLRKWSYAHRGLHNINLPENSMGAFRAALEAGYGIELDIHLMKDGNVAVIHDSDLNRVAGADVKIEDMTLADLDNYRLGGTDEKIPLFREVLELFDGKAPMIVELKCVKNHAELCKAALKMLDSYKGIYCIESFDPRAIRWLKKNRPDVCRGQLASNWVRGKAKMPFFLKMAMSYHISNIYTRPDFIAYNYGDRNTFGTGICRKLWKVQGVSWTLRTQEEYDIAVKDGWVPIFENFKP